MTIAYLDCFSGISGDMLIGALLNAGLPFDELEACVRTLPLHGYQLKMRSEERSGIFGTRFLVELEGQAQPPRNLKTILKIIEQANLSSAVKKSSIGIFEALADAEGKIHNRPPAEIHFHEVGAVDSIVDIVGSVYGLERLGISALFVSALPLGSGFVKAAHGTLPVPAPATMSLLKGAPVYDSGTKHEMVTPTGAALVRGLAQSFGPMPPMIIDTIGYGVGKKDLPDRPNLLRILLGASHAQVPTETVVMLEANTDDSSPEWLGYVMERLFDAGALDVVFCPVQMKKNRPGVQIQVMGRPNQTDTLMDILFRECSTLGIRFRYSQRKVLQRSIVRVDSPWGKMSVKKVLDKEGSSAYVPEYEVCRHLALKNKTPLKEIFFWVMGLNRGK
ncbi:MAG: nickel pincer cofactor biosynthesis protein LarC [Desulfatiglandaceae bacterium]